MPRLSTGSTIKVKGLNETIKALREVGDAERLGLLKDVFYRGAQTVVRAAHGNASNKMEHAAAAGLKASRTQNRAQVAFTERRGFEFGAEFGAAQNQPRRAYRGGTGYHYRGLNQFRPWRGNGEDAGYFLWPAIRETAPKIAEDIGDELERIFEKG